MLSRNDVRQKEIHQRRKFFRLAILKIKTVVIFLLLNNMWRSFSLLQSSSVYFGNLKAACPSTKVNAWTLSVPSRGKIIVTPAHVAVWQKENRFESSPFLDNLTQRYSLEWKVAAGLALGNG